MLRGIFKGANLISKNFNRLIISNLPKNTAF